MVELLEYFDKTEAEVMALMEEDGPRFTRKETAEILRTNLHTLNSWIHRGHVKRRRLFSREDLYLLATVVSLVSGGFTLVRAVEIASIVVKYLAGNGLKPRQVHSGHLGELATEKVAISLDYGSIRAEVDDELKRRGYHA